MQQVRESRIQKDAAESASRVPAQPFLSFQSAHLSSSTCCSAVAAPPLGDGPTVDCATDVGRSSKAPHVASGASALLRWVSQDNNDLRLSTSLVVCNVENDSGLSYRNEAGRPPPNLPLVRGRNFQRYRFQCYSPLVEAS